MFIYRPSVGPAVSTMGVRAAADAQREAAQAREEARVLEQRIDRLALVCEALWGLLQERVGLTEEELLERVRIVDLSDGYPDGKVRRPSLPCPACQRMVSARHARCVYCGAEVSRPSFAG